MTAEPEDRASPAAFSGAAFVGQQQAGASLVMGLPTALAMLCYLLIVFIVGPGPRQGRDTPG